MIDNKNTSIIAIGNCPVMDSQTFLSATQKYQSAMAILYGQYQAWMGKYEKNKI